MKSKDIQFLHKYAIHFLCFTIQNSPIGESDQIPVFVSPMAGFSVNSEIIGKFRKLKKFYGHFVKRQK